MKYLTLCFIMNYVLQVNGYETVFPKIVGGDKVDLEKYPHSARFYNDEGMCAAVILNSCCVLTAAHCMDLNDDTSKMAVVVDSKSLTDHKGQWFNIVHYIIHEGYNRTVTFGCDIAIVFLDEKIHFSKTVKKAILVNHGEWMRKEETHFEVSGWGLKESDGDLSIKLRMTELQFVDRKACEKMHGIKLSEEIFCLYGNGSKDVCNGDSGSGAIWNGMVVGLVSHGKGGCSKVNSPAMFVSVWYFRDWIHNQVKTFFENCRDVRFCQSRFN